LFLKRGFQKLRALAPLASLGLFVFLPLSYRFMQLFFMLGFEASVSSVFCLDNEPRGRSRARSAEESRSHSPPMMSRLLRRYSCFCGLEPQLTELESIILPAKLKAISSAR
jgi:hypothetical protein